MPGWRLKVRGVKKANDTVRRAVREGMRNGLERIGVRGEEIVKENIASPYKGKPAAVFTGGLVNSIDHDVAITPGLGGRVVVFAGAPADVYSAPVETGTRPHFPPVDALIAWVKQKLGATNEKEARRIAFAVARKISRRGTRGHFMFRRALATVRAEARGIMERSLAESLERFGLGR